MESFSVVEHQPICQGTVEDFQAAEQQVIMVIHEGLLHGAVDWIPACAGMTKWGAAMAEWALCP